GYHLVWPRDLVHCAGALLAFGAEPEARDTLRYLTATQTEDGHWYQNQWLGGTPYWTGIQLDEAAMPVLLAQELEERDALGGIAVEDMVRRALGYIARTGPSTAQDRWEENEGINAYTLATLIAAMVAGAALLPAREAEWALALADFWNANIEAWLAVHGTELGRRYDVPGYYLRVAPPSVLADGGDGEPGGHAPRAGVGYRVDPRPLSVSRPADRFGDAARLGACRICQIAGVAAGRAPLWPAPRGLAALSRAAARRAIRVLVAACGHRLDALRRTFGDCPAGAGDRGLGPGRLDGDRGYADDRQRPRLPRRGIGGGGVGAWQLDQFHLARSGN